MFTMFFAGVAAAACPAPYPDWPTDVVDRVLATAAGDATLVSESPVAGLLGATLSLPPPTDTRELDRGWPRRTGTTAGDLAPVFGDVSVRDGRWLVYLYPGVALGIGPQGEAPQFERVPTHQRYWRLCPALAEAWHDADVAGALTGQMKERADRALPEERVVTAPEGAGEAPPPRRKPDPTRWGLGLGYAGAFGESADVLYGGGWGGTGWVSRPVVGILHGRFDLTVNRVTGLPTEWAGVAGSLDSTSYRFALEGRAVLPAGPIALSLGGGPAAGVFRGRLALADAEHAATELMAGARAGADLEIRIGKGGTSLVLDASAEAYLHRSDLDSPLFFAGGALGVQFGGARVEADDAAG